MSLRRRCAATGRWPPDGELVFSSNWAGTYTAMQVLDGGNLLIHNPGNPHRTTDLTPADARQLPLSDRIVSEAFPNPFRDAVEIGFRSGR